ncbi:MAG TPA: prepilin-type N-terminal cleavage/methylation domain-containing protein [Candidatus Paceibacterota bacterium]
MRNKNDAEFTPYHFCNDRSKSDKGFTLMELLVVMGIIVIISSLILASNTRFGGAVILQNLAYDIALSIRQAQVYGISVRGTGASNFNAGYGMYFDTTTNPKNYVLFADTNGNGLYTISAVDSSERIASTDIGRNYYIDAVCAPATIDGNTKLCTSPVERLDIVFRRPEPDAYISADSNSCPVLKGSNCKTSARIVAKSPRGDRMSIIVESNGQIYVEKQY